MLSFMLIISFVFWIISVSLCFYLCLFNYSSIFHNQYFVIPKWLFIKPNTFYIRWNTAMYLSLNECDDVDLCSFEKWLKNHDSFRISTGTITNNRDYFYSFIWFVFFYITFFSLSLYSLFILWVPSPLFLNCLRSRSRSPPAASSMSFKESSLVFLWIQQPFWTMKRSFRMDANTMERPRTFIVAAISCKTVKGVSVLFFYD